MFSHSPFAIAYTGKRRKSIVLRGFFPTNTIWNLLGISLSFFFFFKFRLIHLLFPLLLGKPTKYITCKLACHFLTEHYLFWKHWFVKTEMPCAAAAAAAAPRHRGCTLLNSAGLVTCQVVEHLSGTRIPLSSARPSPTWNAQQFLGSLLWPSTEVEFQGQLLLRDPTFSYGFQLLYKKL